MKIKIENKETVYVVGDIHGQLKTIFDLLLTKEIKNSAMIQVGDFGCGSMMEEERRLNKLNEQLKQFDNILFVVRGNHDDPDYFDGKHNLSNIVFVSDYDILSFIKTDLSEYNILCLGGAVSIDRVPCGDFEGRSVFTYNQKIINELKDIDCVCSHTAPIECKPILFNGGVYKMMEEDNKLEQDLLNERNLMSLVFEQITKNNECRLKKWFYGHFHTTGNQEINGCVFNLLDICEISELRF